MLFMMGSIWWVVAGVAAVAIPVVIHLLHRQRTQPVLWGAMIFLRMSVLQQKRRKRVEHWLLLLARMALMALLAFLLVRPLLNSSGASALTGRPAADIGIVLDHSLSTRWKDGDKTVYEQAVATLQQLTQQDALKPNDTISVVLAEKTPRKISPFLVNRDSVGGLLNTLRSQKPGSTQASIPEAVQAAREVVSRGRNTRKMIIVLSDGQRANWDIQSLDKWNAAVGQRVRGVESNLAVYELPISGQSAEVKRTNAAVLDLTFSPEVIGVNRPIEVRATVRNTGNTDLPATSASLWVDGKQYGVQKPIRALGPKESQPVQFDCTITRPNSSSIEVRLDVADGLDADNVAAGSVFALKSIPVLIIDGQGGGAEMGDASDPASLQRFRASGYLYSAMRADAKDVDAPAFLAPTIISYSDGTRLRDLANGKLNRSVRLPDGTRRQETLGLDHFAAIILNDIPRLDTALQNKLADYVKSGHGLWCIFGRRTEPGYIRDQIAGGNLFRLELKETQDPAEAPIPMDIRNPKYEVLAPFASAERNVLTGMTTLRWWAVKPLEGQAIVPLATASGAAGGAGDPLILEHALGSAGGRVILWTSSVDGVSGWNNWTGMRAFPPLVNFTVYRMSSGITRGYEKRIESGKSIVWASPMLQEKSSSGGGSAGGGSGGGQELVFPDGTVSPPVQWAEVTSPSGVKSRVRPTTRDGRQWAFFGQTFEPGKYEVRFDHSNLPTVYYGVGIDPAELDETRLTADDRKWLTADDHKFIEKSIEPKDLASTLSAGGQKGFEMWPWLAGGLLAFLLFETFMTYRMVNRQAAPTVDLGAMPTA